MPAPSAGDGLGPTREVSHLFRVGDPDPRRDLLEFGGRLGTCLASAEHQLDVREVTRGGQLGGNEVLDVSTALALHSEQLADLGERNRTHTEPVDDGEVTRVR